MKAPCGGCKASPEIGRYGTVLGVGGKWTDGVPLVVPLVRRRYAISRQVARRQRVSAEKPTAEYAEILPRA